MSSEPEVWIIISFKAFSAGKAINHDPPYHTEGRWLSQGTAHV